MGFEKDFELTVKNLLEMAHSNSNRLISSNCLFAISDFEEYQMHDAIETRKKRKKIILDKNLLTFKETIESLKSIYSEVYDISLFVFKSTQELTLVEVQLFMKKSLPNIDGYKSYDREPMLHSKILIPPYANRGEKKFDLNWQLGGLKHEFNMTLWRLKYRVHLFKK